MGFPRDCTFALLCGITESRDQQSYGTVKDKKFYIILTNLHRGIEWDSSMKIVQIFTES